MRIKFEVSEGLHGLDNIAHGFFTRHGGVSEDHLSSLNCCDRRTGDSSANVAENRRRVMDALDLANAVLLIPHLDHGDHAIVIDEDASISTELSQPADALITTRADVALGITYADCLPILIASTDQSVVACIHAGWRGLRCDVIGHTINKLQTKYSGKQWIAAVGPAISPETFLVTSEVSDYFMHAWPRFCHRSPNGAQVDVTAIGMAQLKAAGIELVEKVGGYVDMNADDYYSHRRDGGLTGRHVAVIARKKAK